MPKRISFAKARRLIKARKKARRSSWSRTYVPVVGSCFANHPFRPGTEVKVSEAEDSFDFLPCLPHPEKAYDPDTFSPEVMPSESLVYMDVFFFAGVSMAHFLRFVGGKTEHILLTFDELNYVQRVATIRKKGKR